MKGGGGGGGPGGRGGGGGSGRGNCYVAAGAVGSGRLKQMKSMRSVIALLFRKSASQGRKLQDSSNGTYGRIASYSDGGNSWGRF